MPPSVGSPEAPDGWRLQLGRNLAAARQAARDGQGFTQLEVAERMGVNDATVSAWEKGRGIPDALRLRGLARLYGTSTESLLGDQPLSPDALHVAQLFESLPTREQATLRAIIEAFVVGRDLPAPPQDNVSEEDATARRLLRPVAAPSIAKKGKR